MVRVPQEKLAKSSVPVIVDAADAAVRVGGQYALRLQLGAQNTELTAQAGRAIVDPQRSALEDFANRVRESLRTRDRPFSPEPDPASVQARVRETIDAGLASRFNTTVRSGRASLSAEERGQLATDVPTSTAEALLFGDGTVGERLYQSVLATACRDPRMPDTKCAGENDVGTSGNGDGVGTPPPKPTIEDVVWRALATSPGLGGTRPGVGDVARRVTGLQLASGPADVTALHDFSVLHLAFDNVWQDLLDERVVRTALALRQAILGAGGSLPASGAGTPHTLAFGLWDALDWLGGEVVSLVNGLKGALGLGGAGTSTGGSSTTGSPTRDRNGNPLPPASVPRPPDVPHATTVDPLAEVQRLLAELEAALAEPYRFTVFAADKTGVAINFGLVVTYRQRWTPVTYQAGKLVSTVTLAPKEERTYSRKTTITRKRKTTTQEKFRSLTKTENDVTDRAVRDIVATAQAQTGLEASYSGHGLDIKSTHNDARSSSDTKQSFREAVRKASSEYESDRSLEVTYETSSETTTEETGKVVNPNAELAVTYLFYQLQRRFLVSERIHKLTPVVLVAQPVPKPSELTIKWLLQFDWILRRVLLDPTFAGAFDYLTQDLAGEEFSVLVLKQNVDQQRVIVADIKQNLQGVLVDIAAQYGALVRAKELNQLLQQGLRGFLEALDEGFSPKDLNPDAARVRQQMAQAAYDRAVDAQRSLEERLQRETSVLDAMTDRWVDAQKRFLDKTVEVDRLRLHIKQNILYYMQAIWDHEPPDQRYFRLHRVPVPVITGSLTYSVEDDPNAIPMPPTWTKPTVLKAKPDLHVDPQQTKPLAEIADLDNPLGYKGNYMMFPLVDTENVLAKYMMVPYADRASGIHDPDQPGNLTRAELDQYVCCLKKNLSAADFEALLPGINEAYQRLLSDPRPSEEEIIVPTSSLYIEALPAAQPVLEDFQLLHRAADVERAAIQNAGATLDNIRHAARILGGDLTGDFEKNILVSGAKGVTVEDGEH
jgi:hypothetical protein